MDAQEIRNTVLKAIYSDSELVEVLVLKGGNALRLHNVTNRESQDLDFSVKEEIRFSKENEGKRLETLLTKAFDQKGFLVNHYKFEDRPKSRHEKIPPFWGGYKVSFSLIDKVKYKKEIEEIDPDKIGDLNKYGEELENGTKTIQIDLSYDEYIGQKVSYNLDGTTIFIYSPLMIIYEKIRASCQQLDEYELSSSKTRARDLYDIYKTLTSYQFSFLREEVINKKNFDLLNRIFKAKAVPIDLIPKIDTKEEDLRIDYEERVLPQISNDDDKIPFDYLFEYNKELFHELYKKLLHTDL